jgi:hypothetical protein
MADIWSLMQTSGELSSPACETMSSISIEESLGKAPTSSVCTKRGRHQCTSIAVLDQNLYRSLTPPGMAVCVVANSVHGGNGQHLLSGADLLLAAIAEWIGFRVESIEVARRSKRRDSGSSLIRESVILCRRRQIERPNRAASMREHDELDSPIALSMWLRGMSARAGRTARGAAVR